MKQSAREIHSAIDECMKCEEPIGKGFCKVSGVHRGRVSSKIMTIGMAPSKTTERKKLAFAGNSFTRLHSWFNLAGFSCDKELLRKSLYQTSLLKCRVEPDTAASRRKMYTACQAHLWKQIDLVTPKLILVLGEEPLSRLLRRKVKLKNYLARVFVTSEIFPQNLFPDVAFKARWMSIPHPSGASRTMNDTAVKDKVVGILRRELSTIGLA